MRLWPEGIDEMSANYRWGVELRLRMIEDVVCAPRASGTGGPGMEESMERARRTAQRGIRKLRTRPSWTASELRCGRGGRTFPNVNCSPISSGGPPYGGKAELATR